MAEKKKDNTTQTAESMFGFQDLMNDYYQSDPQDDAGKLQKRTFQASMIGQNLTGQQAREQAELNQNLKMAGTKQAMDLAMRNEEQAMKTQNM